MSSAAGLPAAPEDVLVRREIVLTCDMVTAGKSARFAVNAPMSVRASETVAIESVGWQDR